MRRLRLKPALVQNRSLSLSLRKDQHRLFRAAACYHAAYGLLSDSVSDNRPGARIFAGHAQDMFGSPVFCGNQETGGYKWASGKKRLSGVLPGAGKKRKAVRKHCLPGQSGRKNRLILLVQLQVLLQVLLLLQELLLLLRELLLLLQVLLPLLQVLPLR
ncbi:MAG: hypothetical protein K4305_04420 [Chlorobium sp.]|uniref:hypothetical protein n=1 Tax=Chlorobium sp. TaxID=1095 RepID=UPI002F4111E3